MPVIIKHATARQVKALAKNLQKVIPTTLNTAPVTLHQAQTIAAQALGHADFHAAQRFYPEEAPVAGGPRVAMLFAPTTIPSFKIPVDHAIPGPPEAIVERLMQTLGKHHAPEWPHWRTRRLLILAAVQSAWGARAGASLTAAQIRDQLHDAPFRYQGTEAGHAYLHFLHRLEGTSDQEHLGKQAQEVHQANVQDWQQVLPEPLSAEAQARARTFQALSKQLTLLLHRTYPHSPRLTIQGVAHLLHENHGIWSARARLPMEAAFDALMVLMPEGVIKTQGHLLDLFDNLDLRWVLAHDQSPLPTALRDRFRQDLVTLPGWRTDFSLLSEVPLPAPGTDLQNQSLVRYWQGLREANS